MQKLKPCVAKAGSKTPAPQKTLQWKEKTLQWKERRVETPPQSTGGTRQRYDLKWHSREFNPWNHGYIWKKGYMWYRRPDGVDVRAHSAVNEMTEEGELLPKCNFTA